MYEYLIGKAAHYVAYNGKHLAAIVIGIEELQGVMIADLAVITNMLSVNGMKNYGLQFHQMVMYSDAQAPGSWHWLEGHSNGQS